MQNSFITKHLLWWCAVFMFIVLLIIFTYRTGTALYYNQQLRDQFPNEVDSSQYQNRIPMEKMDFTIFDSYFPNNFAAIHYPLVNRIETPLTIKYYTEIPTDEASVALEISKGTNIIAIPEGTKGSPLHETGYGYTSYPTYERGWRYVRPFITPENSDYVDREQYYYVKIETLEAILDKVIEVNPSLRSTLSQQGLTTNKGKYIISRYVDKALYQHGAYLSPDLFYRIFDRVNIILLVVLTLTIVLIFLLRNRLR